MRPAGGKREERARGEREMGGEATSDDEEQEAAAQGISSAQLMACQPDAHATAAAAALVLY